MYQFYSAGMCTIEASDGNIAATGTTSHTVTTCCSHICKYVRRGSVKGERPAVKGVKPIAPHYNLVVWRQSRQIIGKLPSVKGSKCRLLTSLPTWATGTI